MYSLWKHIIYGQKVIVLLGGSSLHFLLGTSKGNSFKEAVINWMNNNPDYKKFFDENRLTYWGCRLFPTEEEAAKSFG